MGQLNDRKVASERSESKVDVNGELSKKSQELSNGGKILTSLAAGGIAGGIAKTVIAPLDRSKIFFQTNETKKLQIPVCLTVAEAWIQNRRVAIFMEGKHC